MNEFRTKLTLYFKASGIEHAKTIIEAILLAHEDSKASHGGDDESTGVVQFNHPSLGWVDLDTDDSDDDLDGEAYLAQSG